MILHNVYKVSCTSEIYIYIYGINIWSPLAYRRHVATRSQIFSWDGEGYTLWSVSLIVFVGFLTDGMMKFGRRDLKALKIIIIINSKKGSLFCRPEWLKSMKNIVRRRTVIFRIGIISQNGETAYVSSWTETNVKNTQITHNSQESKNMVSGLESYLMLVHDEVIKFIG